MYILRWDKILINKSVLISSYYVWNDKSLSIVIVVHFIVRWEMRGNMIINAAYSL